MSARDSHDSDPSNSETSRQKRNREDEAKTQALISIMQKSSSTLKVMVQDTIDTEESDAKSRMYGWNTEAHWCRLESFNMNPQIIKRSECPLERADKMSSSITNKDRGYFAANFAAPGMGKTMGMFLQTRQFLENHPTAKAVYVTYNGDHQPPRFDGDLATQQVRQNILFQDLSFGWRLLHSACMPSGLNLKQTRSSEFKKETLKFASDVAQVDASLDEYVKAVRLFLKMASEHLLVVALDEIGKSDCFSSGMASPAQFILELNRSLMETSSRLIVSLLAQQAFSALIEKSQGGLCFHNVGPIRPTTVVPDFLYHGKDGKGLLYADRLVDLMKLSKVGFHSRSIEIWRKCSLSGKDFEGQEWNPETVCFDATDGEFDLSKLRNEITKRLFVVTDIKNDSLALKMVQASLLSLQFAKKGSTNYGMRIPPIVVLHVMESVGSPPPTHFPESIRIMGFEEVAYRLAIALMSIPQHKTRLRISSEPTSDTFQGPESYDFLLRHGQKELYRSHLSEGKLFEETMMFWALGRVLSNSSRSCRVQDLFLLDFVAQETQDKRVLIPEVSNVSLYRAVILGSAGKASTPASVKKTTTPASVKKTTTPASVKKTILDELKRHKVCCVFPDAAYNSPQDFSIYVLQSDNSICGFHFQAKEWTDTIEKKDLETVLSKYRDHSQYLQLEDEENNLEEVKGTKMQTNHFILLTVNYKPVESLDGNVNVVSMIKKKEQKEKEMELGKCCLENPTLQFSNSFVIKGQKIETPQSSPNLQVAK